MSDSKARAMHQISKTITAERLKQTAVRLGASAMFSPQGRSPASLSNQATRSSASAKSLEMGTDIPLEDLGQVGSEDLEGQRNTGTTVI